MKCPSDTKDLVNQNNISNFSLRYQHFLNYENDEKVKGKVKFPVDDMALGGSQDAIIPLRDRQTNQLNYLEKTYHVFCEFYDVDWRMVIGLGGEHVQETSMTLDHVYGIPYIPGSAFKGVVRSWVIQENFNDEEHAMQDANFLKVFGSQKSAGKVQFLPAYPIDNVLLSLDIMNPHFPEYYTGSKLPTDTQDPMPIKFLTVGQTSFRFVFLSKDQNLKILVKGWVDKALKDKGLGAKTAVGYGYFRPSPGGIPNRFKPDRNFQVPLRTRPEKRKQISFNEAYEQFDDSNQSNPQLQLIDITPIKKYASEFAQLATRESIEITENNELDGLRNELPQLLIDDKDEIMISDFGKWIWGNLKVNLLSSRILELPRLVYSPNFRKSLKRLPADELVAVQEKLIAISNQLEESNMDIESITVTGHFRSEGDLVIQTELTDVQLIAILNQ